MSHSKIASIVSKAPPDISSGDFNPEQPCSVFGWPSVTHFRAHQFSFPWHRGPSLLAFTFSGVCFGEAEGILSYGDQRSAILLGEDPRRFGKAGNTVLEQVVFFFPTEFIDSSLDDLTRPLSSALEPQSAHEHRGPNKINPNLIADSPAMRNVARIARETILGGCAQTHRLEELRIELFTHLAAHQGMTRWRAPEKPCLNEELSRRLDRAHDLIHDCSQEKLLLGDLAKFAGVSPFHFLREFKRKFGATPNQMQTRIRLQTAKKLLRNDSVTSVCFAVGYESLGTFSSLFRREVGVTPTEYQRLGHPIENHREMPDLTIPDQFWISALATKSVGDYGPGAVELSAS